MGDYRLVEDSFQKWSAKQLANYMRSKGLGDYEEMFLANNITGEVAPLLDDGKLKEMGVVKIGDRLKMMDVLKALQTAQMEIDFNTVIWEGEEVLYFSGFEQARDTCCGCCPVDASKYKLTHNNLEIKISEPVRCGPITIGCLDPKYSIDNVDLSGVEDADVEGIPPTCFQQVFCCGKSQEHVTIKTASEGDKVLKLPEGEGQAAAIKIKNQVEVMQRMERS